MELGFLRGLITLLLLALFLGIWMWSWSRNRRRDFDEASRLPLEDDSQPPKQKIGNDEMREQQS